MVANKQKKEPVTRREGKLYNRMHKKVDESTMWNKEFKVPTVLQELRQCWEDNYCWFK